MKLISIYKNELRINITWHFAWIFTLGFLLLLIIIIYPGDQAMKDFMPLLQIDLFEAFIGSIGGSSPNYTLWIAILIPMIVIAYFLYGITTGVRVVNQSISDHTGELIHTLPVSRNNFLLTRILVTFLPFLLFFLLQFFLFWTNIFGQNIETKKLLTITWWGILFMICTMFIGIALGLIAGNTGRGYQFSLLFVLILYVMQIIGRLQPDYANLNNFNPLNFYQPEIVLLTDTMEEGKLLDQSFPLFPIYTLILTIILILLVFFEFNRKDLSEDAGIHFNTSKLVKNQNKLVILVLSIWKEFKKVIISKKIRNNPFVFWARIFERRSPITADFIYSDNMTLLISFMAFVTIFPFQLALYPGDTLIKKSIAGFSSNPFFLFITYGIDLTKNPYLWFLVSQTLGILWVVLLPLSAYWAYKAVLKDGNTQTGEILGSIPINSKDVVFQRLFAIFLELLYLNFWIIVFVIISEQITGSSYDLVWEIITILSGIPFYCFLITLMFEINLSFKRKGTIISILFLFFIVISFFISVVIKSFDYWYIRGIFSLYNPVLILQQKSLVVANYGLFLLCFMTIFLLLVLTRLKNRFIWVNIIDDTHDLQIQSKN